MSSTSAGDVSSSGGVAVGEGAAAANVTINQSEPGIRDMIKMLWLQSLTEQDERKRRQDEVDTRLLDIHTRLLGLEQLVRGLISLRRMVQMAGASGVTALTVAGYELGLRLGWW